MPTKADIYNAKLNRNDGESPGEILLELRTRKENNDETLFLKEDMLVSPAFSLDKKCASKKRQHYFDSLQKRPMLRDLIGSPRDHVKQARVMKEKVFETRL